MVALVEKEVNRSLDSRQPRRKFPRSRYLEQFLRLGQQLLGAGNPFLDSRVAADEGVGNLIDTEAAQDVKNECDLRLYRQTRITAGKHHAQQVILDFVGPE